MFINNDSETAAAIAKEYLAYFTQFNSLTEYKLKINGKTKFYSASPSILFTGGSKADEMIRSWFDLDGEGRYSMSMTFGRVLIGDCGYRLILEDGKLYQVPLLHEDTEFRVYYKENGETTYLFDAADLLRNLRIEMPEEEAEKVLARLKEAGYLD